MSFLGYTHSLSTVKIKNSNVLLIINSKNNIISSKHVNLTENIINNKIIHVIKSLIIY